MLPAKPDVGRGFAVVEVSWTLLRSPWVFTRALDEEDIFVALIIHSGCMAGISNAIQLQIINIVDLCRVGHEFRALVVQFAGAFHH